MTSHPDSRHLFAERHLQLRDEVTCGHDGCTHTVTRCTTSELWPWSCDHCGPADTPAIVAHRGASTAPPLRVAHPVATRPATTTPPVRVVARDVERKYLREADTTDLVNDLVDHTTHHEPYTRQRRNPDGTHTLVTERWRTTNPPLLEQLSTAVAQSAAAEEGPRAGFASKPAARIDAIDALAKITRDVERWLKRTDLHLEIPYLPGSHGTSEVDLRAGVRRVAAAAGQHRDIARDVRSWWIIARTVTGWDSPAWRPRVGCPNCDVVGGLRIRLDVKTAVCVECWAEWDESTIGILADHINAETDGDGVVEEVGA